MVFSIYTSGYREQDYPITAKVYQYSYVTIIITTTTTSILFLFRNKTINMIQWSNMSLIINR